MSHETVTVAISTYGDRAYDVEPPAAAGLHYMILVQQAPRDLAPVNRPDVTWIQLETIGLSHSRNAALDYCTTPYLLFADDDHELSHDGISALATALAADPGLAFAIGVRGRADSHPPVLRTASDVRRWNIGRVCAPELMLRCADMKALGIRFDTNFGVGARYPSGEDYIFVCDMLKAGAQGRSFPIITGYHKTPSTGDDWSDVTLLDARRRVLSRVFGRWSLFATPVYAWRHRHRFVNWRQALDFVIGTL